jgi:hypothetical protein
MPRARLNVRSRLLDRAPRASWFVERAGGLERRGVRLALVCLAIAALFAAYHLYLRRLMLDTGLLLGAVRPGVKVYRIVPLYVYWHCHWKTGLLIALAVIAALLVWFNRVGRERLSRPRFVLALMAWHVVVACAVAMIDGGPHKLWQPYTVHHRSDYIGAVPHVETAGRFLADYARLMPDLPLHCRHHPPGGPLFLWLVARLIAPGPIAASLMTILVSSLAIPAVYRLAREALDEPAARLATLLFMLAPNVVCYSATCLDAVFMVPMVWSFAFLWRGRTERPVVRGIAAGAATALAALMTFSASFIAAWALGALLFPTAIDRQRLRNTALCLGAAVLTAMTCYVWLHAWSGYDPWQVLQAAFEGQAAVMKGRGHSSTRQSVHFALANLVAFGTCAGLPLTVLSLGQAAREFVGRTATPGRALTLSFFLALLVVDLAPLYTLETERIWIFMVPFLSIAAAAWLERERSARPQSHLTLWALLLLAGQTVLMETLLEMVW